ncbi:FAD-dependent oxidoreductase [Candidatus Woesearchaeota archaeon]|nr:FAD-dependent oxidoreductase [Candidatus Woesearchaeota archaeon]
MPFVESVGSVSKVESITPDVIVLELKVSSEFKFEAGQFVNFKLSEGSKALPRPYSILSAPSKKGVLEFCIKLVDGGFASEIFKKIIIGEKIPFRGPIGGFTFAKGSLNKRHCFICTGTGIAPMMSILNENIGKFPDRQFELIFGTKTRKDILFEGELKKLKEEHKNFDYKITLSREDWEGLKGRVQQHLPEDLSKTTFYICGLKDMVLSTKQLLLSKGVDEKDIKIERFT